MITKEDVYARIRYVIDPEVGFNLVEMGLIYDAIITDGDVEVIMTLSTRGCPLHQMMTEWVENAVKNIPEVKNVKVTIVWEPAWNITMAEEHVREAMGGGARQSFW